MFCISILTFISSLLISLFLLQPYRVFLENNNLEQVRISPRPELRTSKLGILIYLSFSFLLLMFCAEKFPKIETVSLAEVPEVV